MKPSDELNLANQLSYEEDYEFIVMSGSWIEKWVYKKSQSTLEEFAEGKSLKSVLGLGAKSDQRCKRMAKKKHKKFFSEEAHSASKK